MFNSEGGGDHLGDGYSGDGDDDVPDFVGHGFGGHIASG
jgi:hypothetical protein